MEENTVELYDYINVIWKRKIIIIVVILVSTAIGVGVAVKESKSNFLPVKSCTVDAIVKIGQQVKMSLNDAELVPMDDPEDLVETIRIKFSENTDGAHGYHLDAEQIGTLPMIRLVLVGQDERVKGVLEEIVKKLEDEHREKARFSAAAYKDFIKRLEEDSRTIQANITIIEKSILKMKRQEQLTMEHMNRNENGKEERGNDMGDLSVIWNMLYLKTIDKEIDLNASRRNLRDIQWKLLVHRTTIESLEKYSTGLIGKIKMSTSVMTKPLRPGKNIMVAAVAGLILSLFIAFFIEYIEESKLKRKRK